MRKNILIIAATTKELTPFLKKLREGSGLINGYTIDVLISGVGLTSTTYRLTKQLLLKRPDLIIQAGIAGSFNKPTQAGTLVLVKQDRIADESVIESGELKTIYDLKLESPNKFPFSGGWLINKEEALKKIPISKVKAITVNHVSTSKKMIGLYADKFKPAIESMEGAALHYVALSEKIPFIQLRAISNHIGERNKKNWKLKESISNLNNGIITVLKHL